MTWVVKDDVIGRVKAEGLTSDNEVERRAQQIWEQLCFPLDIYCTAQGEEGTQAEFMLAWLCSGYSWAESKKHLTTLSRSNASKRSLPESFRAEAMKRLRENLAKTYNPGALDGDQAGEDSNSCDWRVGMKRRLGETPADCINAGRRRHAGKLC